MTLHVLIVEDELDFRDYLVHAINWEYYDMRVIGAVPDLEPARNVVSTSRVDLILLDITLQRGNGLDLIPDIRTAQPSPRVVVITGHGEFETVRRALRLGVHDYLLKPFAKQELLMSVLSNREHLLSRLAHERSQASLNEAIVDSWLYQLTQVGSVEEAGKLIRLLSQYHVDLPGPYSTLLCCSDSGESSAWGRSGRWLEHLAEVWKTAVEQQAALTWVGLDGRVYVLVGSAEPSELAWEARDTASELVSHAARYLKLDLRIGISSVHERPGGAGANPFSILGRQSTLAQSLATDSEPVVTWQAELEANGEAAGDALDSRYRMAMRFIERFHHDPSLDVQTVAAHFGISTEYLRRIFQSGAGTTCVHAIALRRVEHAKALLTAGEVSVADVARRSGFRDPAYFSRVFKRTTGTTPAEYRRGARSYDPGWA